MTITDHFRCPSCGPVAVDLQVPAGMTLREVGFSLASITFESQVIHDLEAHLDEVTG